MKYTVIPYVWTGDQWSLSDVVMGQVWDEMYENKLHEIVFCTGGIYEAADFIRYFRQQSNLMHLVMMDDQVGAFMWLNGIKDNHALWHGCAFPRAEPCATWPTVYSHWARPSSTSFVSPPRWSFRQSSVFDPVDLG